jgi:hypothetical protein|tara:strand:+ start:3980 stop:4474 length:495 start_codon:yes stop_codon:yes gene_type:complete
MIVKNGIIAYYKSRVNNDYLIKKYNFDFNQEKINYTQTYDYYYFILPNFISDMVKEGVTLHPPGIQLAKSKHFTNNKRKKIKSKKSSYLIIHVIDGESKIFIPNKKKSLLSKIKGMKESDFDYEILSKGDVVILPKGSTFYIENQSTILTHELREVRTDGLVIQ